LKTAAATCVAYPQKRPLIRLTTRPPQLETPFAVFNEGLITPNDAFFVRYHLADIPTSIDPATFRLRVHGSVRTPLELSLRELKALAAPVEVVAVNQCSGNSRGFFAPRVGGGQLAHGAMGNARWTGVPLKAVLERAGVNATARQVVCNGLDQPVVPTTPDFVKALELDHAMDGEVLLAYAMNGEDLPMLNGYPLRLVVPGYYGTYWVKHLNDLEVVDSVFSGFWMKHGVPRARQRDPLGRARRGAEENRANQPLQHPLVHHQLGRWLGGSRPGRDDRARHRI
jgi:DMSO/TMAO reductase YedYZ molybdopterin-dependent catalytic subunit